MENLTPWNKAENQSSPAENSADEPTEKEGGLRVALNGNWGYVWAAVGSLITLVLLFQPWLTASGPNGKAATNAFGRINASTRYLTVWSSTKPMPLAHITGFWALLTTAAIIVCVLTAMINLRTRNKILERVTAISSVAVAIFTICTLLYINSKAPELKEMTSRRWDLGGQLGSVMSWVFGNDKLPFPGISETRYSTSSLTLTALLACFTSIGSALAASIQHVFAGTTKPFRLLWRPPPSDPDTDST
ncbi:hypothetical protein [Nocardia arthritidis]|uniref:hypothetical protein n=1 Tax=Nocardia arthritidis TaxID=228602 RepID=UPI000AF8A20A|nr:hypothetical protein [Nocardia arthritidis]